MQTIGAEVMLAVTALEHLHNYFNTRAKNGTKVEFIFHFCSMLLINTHEK